MRHVEQRLSKSFAEMTEEERIEWAKNHTWEPRLRNTHNKVLASKRRDNAKKTVQVAIKNHTTYRDPKRRVKHWGDDYNARIRYLYQHNEEFRELKKFRVSLRNFQRNKGKYDAWYVKYYRDYRGRMGEKAPIYQLAGTYNYVHGYSIKDLKGLSPLTPAQLNQFVSHNLIPPPKYSGHKFVKDKLSTTQEDFYLVSEVEAMLNVFAGYRHKFSLITKEEQRLYLKKQFWNRMLEEREKFDND